MDAVSVLIEWLREKKQISQLEADLLDTSDELSKEPFDRRSASLRMGLNYERYPDIFFEAKRATGEIAKPNYVLSDEEIKGNLRWQILKLAEKEVDN